MRGVSGGEGAVDVLQFVAGEFPGIALGTRVYLFLLSAEDADLCDCGIFVVGDFGGWVGGCDDFVDLGDVIGWALRIWAGKAVLHLKTSGVENLMVNATIGWSTLGVTWRGAGAAERAGFENR